MKRWVLIGGGIVVVIAVAVFVLWSNVGSVIKTAVEKFGSEIFQAQVTLNEADVSATSGEGALKGLTVGNPSGFKTDSAFKLGMVSVQVDIGTLIDDPIVIKEIVVQAPEVTYEYASAGSNLDALKENAESYVGGSGGGSSASDDSAGKKLVIENLYIRDGRINVSADFLGGRKIGTALPEIHLTDIGKDKGGAGPGEIAEKIIAAVTAAAGKAVSSLDVEGLSKAAQEQLGIVQERASEAMEEATENLPAGAADTLKEGMGGAGDALKGLLGGEK